VFTGKYPHGVIVGPLKIPDRPGGVDIFRMVCPRREMGHGKLLNPLAYI
jgi:hypothetical protein